MYMFNPTLANRCPFAARRRWQRSSTGMSARCVRIPALKEKLDRLDTIMTPDFDEKREKT